MTTATPAKTRKAPAKKAASTPTSGSITVEMKHSKETKGTFVYSCDADDAAVTQLYVRKSAFPNGAPASIKLTID